MLELKSVIVPVKIRTASYPQGHFSNQDLTRIYSVKYSFGTLLENPKEGVNGLPRRAASIFVPAFLKALLVDSSG